MLIHAVQLRFVFYYIFKRVFSILFRSFIDINPTLKCLIFLLNIYLRPIMGNDSLKFVKESQIE